MHYVLNLIVTSGSIIGLLMGVALHKSKGSSHCKLWLRGVCSILAAHPVLLTLGKMEKMVQLSDLYPPKIDILWRSEQLKSKYLAGPFLRNCILKFFIR